MQELPPATKVREMLLVALRILRNTSEELRPRAQTEDGWLPGGLLRLDDRLPCVVVPDLHARASFVDALLEKRLPSHDANIRSMLDAGLLQLVFLGDIPHAEGEAARERWVTAYSRWMRGGSPSALLCPEMDEEMSLALVALEKVIRAMERWPEHVFCLKGNHDNLTNVTAHGDFGFYKYADEGAMGALWLHQRYGEEIEHLIRSYERSLPLVAVHEAFCASHAEPACMLDEAALLSYRIRPDVVQALIWTGNDEAEPGSVEKTLTALLGADKARHAVWIAGHRPVAHHFGFRAGGRLLQIHNPSLQQAVLIHESPARADFLDFGTPGE
ncbi:MAG: hypothetical protein QHH01_03615, partial [Spirochaetales bacterium]|nr:hypothetical protein [Spirochaetales bacterium]